MRDAILVELTRKWEHDAREPEMQNGSDDMKIRNAIAQGIREGKRECADCLRALISIIGDGSKLHEDFPYASTGYDPVPLRDKR